MLVDNEENYSPSERLLGAVMLIAASVIAAVSADVASNGYLTRWFSGSHQPRETE